MVKGLDQLDAKDKRVLLRADLNVPLDADGHIGDASRIERVLPTLEALLGQGARLILLSHLGRPKGVRRPELSLSPVAEALRTRLQAPVQFVEDLVGPAAQAAVHGLEPGHLLLLDNLRFDPREEANDPNFAAELASLGEVFVHDAFATAHRAHASTEALAHHLPAYAGLLMQAELTALGQALSNPARPLTALVGGAKVSTKFELLFNLIDKADALLIGGAMANTFLYAQGHSMGTSLAEPDLANRVLALMKAAEEAGCAIHLPSDLVVADSFSADAAHAVVEASAVPADRMALDFGPQTRAAFAQVVRDSESFIWNGPLGAFELAPFSGATFDLAEVVAEQTRAGNLVSVAGGGDTVAALNQAGLARALSYVSTAGGAFLEWMEGKVLPGVAALETPA